MSFASLGNTLRPRRHAGTGQSRLSRPASFWSLHLGTGGRPLTAYDAPFGHTLADDDDEAPEEAQDEGTRANGVRVWYSSFTSIDWLHDAIKDSARLLHLRRRRSPRGKARAAADRFVGWLIVTLVGLITALIAWCIVRSEQLLFDIKEGHCAAGWWKAKRFCCPLTAEIDLYRQEEEVCDAWHTWAETFSVDDRAGRTEGWMVDYIAYIIIALFLATVSSVLTLRLTASTSFVSNKDSGVLAPSFGQPAAATPDGSKANGKQRAGSVTPPAPRKVMYFAAGSGIPEIKTILSGFVIHGYLGGRTLFTKAVGLTLSVASGLSLGKEGPFVHIASCVGNIVSRFFPKYETNEAKRREILSAACAAGVAVAFGAPVGGVLFSLEEVSYFFPPKVMWRSFFCAMIAAGTLKFLNPFGTGKLVLFQVTYDKDWHAYELVFFLLLGVIGGVYGAYFSKLNYRWSRDVRNATWLRTHPVSEVLLVTLATTLLSFLNPFTRMGGTELVYNLFAECREGEHHAGLCVPTGDYAASSAVAKSIGIALLVKGVMTIVTFGIKLPAGIFIPTLGVGACCGRILGLAVQAAQWRISGTDSVIPGVYAMVGAAAALSGVTRTTVSLAVIMFELTDTLTYVIPVMLAVLVAKTVADALEPKGIYDLVIQLNQLPYLDAKHQHLWGSMSVMDVGDSHAATIRVEDTNTVMQLRDKLLQLVSQGDQDSGFAILRQDGRGSRLVGYVGANELEHALTIVADEPNAPCHFHTADPRREDAYSVSSLSTSGGMPIGKGGDPFDFSVYMDQAPLTVQTNSPLELVQQLFVKLGARYLVVVDSDGYYQGVIDKKTWLAFVTQLEEQH
ncbi:clc channel [Exidia glandulosa HHB12029]|uniref:Chloride channel protein n=1 Tax=Exidia glandulosa HHB12029 TaxID=1314781 RepID=A0A165P9K8_EXIGL|nr:clc channel [Exidia glandulosa HHB12029]